MIRYPRKFNSVSQSPINTKAMTDLVFIEDIMDALLDVPQNVGQLFSKPQDYISSITLYPINITFPTFGLLKIDNGLFNVTTNIVAWKISEEATLVNLGEWYCNRKFNNFADYAGYTTIKLFLPFLGFIELPVNEIMGKYVQLRMNIDFNTGQAMYIVGVTENSLGSNFSTWQILSDSFDINTRILSTHPFQLGIDVPIGSGNAGDVYRNLLTGAVKIGGIALGYGIGNMLGASVALSTASTATETVDTYNGKITERNPSTGRQITTSTKKSENITSTKSTTQRNVDYTSRRKSQTVNGCIDVASTTLSSINIHGETTNPNNPSVFVSSPIIPTFIVYTPRFKEVDRTYNKLYGKPLGEVKKISTIGGYTEISQLHIEGDGFNHATETEKQMLDTILRSGIILPDVIPDMYNIYYNFSNINLTSKPTTIARVDGVETIQFTNLFKGTLNFSVLGAEISNIFVNGNATAIMPTELLAGDIVKFDISNALNDVNVNINVTPADRNKFTISYRLATESSSNITFINKPTEIYEGGSVTVSFKVNVSGSLTTSLATDSAPANLTNFNYNRPSSVAAGDTVYQFEIETTSATNGEIIVRIGLT